MKLAEVKDLYLVEVYLWKKIAVISLENMLVVPVLFIKYVPSVGQGNQRSIILDKYEIVSTGNGVVRIQIRV